MLGDEQNLVRKAKDGEASAFGSLYDHYLPKIYRFVLLKVSLREEAEDLTHQVFLKAWQNISTYNFQGYPFGTWLYQIARNTVIDHYRSSNPHTSLEATAFDIAAEGKSLQEVAEGSLQWDVILKGIRQLKETEQDVLIMRFVEDMTPREVAAAIGKSESAVKLIQHRAIKRLKELLSSDYDQ